MFKLLGSAFKRLITAITSPFRLMIVKIGRTLNFNVLTAKLISPITKKVKSLITLRPQSWKDYYKIGKRYVYKKLFLTITLIICAAIFILFTMFLPPIPTVPQEAEQVVTDVTYSYDDMKLREFTGVANIKADDQRIVYTGAIEAGNATGTGTLRDRDGKLVYIGEFLKNEYSGNGIQYYPASGKIKYEGTFKKNLYNGVGSAYDEEGNLVYSGTFVDGLYEGEGQVYNTKGVMLYEGSFLKGRYHGIGTYYYENGVVKYNGEFFEGAAQGIGSIYSSTGKLLYTGAMFNGTINYRSLMRATLADIDNMFAETPTIYYSFGDCVFVYEQAGCAFTVNCAVRIFKQANTAAPEKAPSSFFFLPDGSVTAGDGTTVTPPLTSSEPIVIGEPDPNLSSSSSSSLSSLPSSSLPPSSSTPASGLAAKGDWALKDMPVQLGAKLPPLFIEQLAWEVTDSGSGVSGSSASSSSASSGNSGSGSASGATSSGAGSSGSGATSGSGSSGTGSSSSGGTISSGGSASGETPGTGEPGKGNIPDFVEATYTIYFEVDSNVWQSEETLDRSKIQVDAVVVFNGDEPVELEGAVEYENNDPPSLADCVAINFIRNSTPTAFPNIVYEMDSQMRLIVEIKGINYAGMIVRRAFSDNNLTYLYCYQYGDEAEKLMYYIIEG